MTGLTKGEARVLELIKRCDFNGTGCWPTQDELAFMSGYKRPYVNACVKGIERKGHMRIEKRRRPGCKWTHNVYFVRDWSPNVRRGIVNLRSAFKDSQARRSSCSQASSDTERTAKPSRAQTPGVNPFLTAAVENKRCGREARANRNGPSRRTWMQEARFHRQERHLHVADITCIHCREKDQELEQKAEIIQKLARENSELADKFLGATEAANAAGRAAAAAKAQRTREAKKAATADQIAAVVAHWRSHRPKASSAFGEPGSKSYGIIEKAIVLMGKDEAGPVGACCEAIDGLHLAPYQEFDRWYATDGPKRTLRNGVEYALGDESRIERCRMVARKAQNASLEAKRWAYDRTLEVHEAWSRALFGELWKPPTDDSIEVDGIVVRP